jgi:tetratricopeptide (TPR) repeat protein
MSQWMQWYLLSSLLGNPLAAAVAVAAFWWLGDRVTFRLFPDPVRAFERWRREGRLRAVLAVNPHDRRARFELAERLLESRRPREAAEVLRPNVEAGDDDAHTAYVMGAALGRSGAAEAAERALAVARETDPKFRAGEIHLELGRQRVARRDFAGARDALTALLVDRPGTVQGRYWLARALAGLGDAAGARRVREEAWREYAALPRFHRRHERAFAWRVKPWRPAAVLAAVVLAAALLAQVVVPAASAPARDDGWSSGAVVDE